MDEPDDLPEVQKSIRQQLSLAGPQGSEEELLNSLVTEIEYLLLHDFDKLVSMLYRLDISEAKIKEIFNNTQKHIPENAGAALLISKIIVERQLQKLKSRRENSGNQRPETDEAEKW